MPNILSDFSPVLQLNVLNYKAMRAIVRLFRIVPREPGHMVKQPQMMAQTGVLLLLYRTLTRDLVF